MKQQLPRFLGPSTKIGLLTPRFVTRDVMNNGRLDLRRRLADRISMFDSKERGNFLPFRFRLRDQILISQDQALI